MISAGRVLIIPKGAWNDTDTYSMLDLVSYNGSSYIAKTSVPANTLPTNTSYWQLSAYGGSAANLAGNFAPLETTDYASQGYAVGDFLVNKDNQFCKATSIITIGDELILKPNDNYNIEADNVGAEINAVKEDLKDLDDSLSEVAKSGEYSDLLHKPTLGTAAAKNATDTITEDSTDLIEGGAVFDALALKANAEDLGTAAAKDSTNAVTEDSTDLVESGAVYSEIQSLDNSKAAKTQITNPNLIDNPWFTINQRGETSSYFADRWIRYVPEITFTNNNGVTISGTLSSSDMHLGEQKIEWDRLKDNIGKSITLSVLINGTIYKAVGKIETPTSSWLSHVSLQIPSLNIWFQLLTNGTSPSVAELYLKNINADAINVTIKAVKLEVGSVSTLAMDTAPNYATELLKCQRYFNNQIMPQSC